MAREVRVLVRVSRHSGQRFGLGRETCITRAASLTPFPAASGLTCLEELPGNRRDVGHVAHPVPTGPDGVHRASRRSTSSPKIAHVLLDCFARLFCSMGKLVARMAGKPRLPRDPALALPGCPPRKKSCIDQIPLAKRQRIDYSPTQCTQRPTPPAFLPNPAKALVRASSAGSAPRFAASLAAASTSPPPCAAPPCREPAGTTPRCKPLRPAGCLFHSGRAPRSLPRSSCRTGSRRRCSPAVTTAPRPRAARHVATDTTRPSPRRHSLSSAQKPVRSSTPPSRTAIPRPWNWCFPPSPGTSAN